MDQLLFFDLVKLRLTSIVQKYKINLVTFI